MNSSVQKIKERLNIEEVVSSYLKLKKAGSNLKARCPFHNEKSPSFFVSPARESYYCFGCGAKGDIFTFVEEFEGLDFKGTLKLLAERAGVTLAEWRPGETSEATEKERLYRVMEEAAEYFQSNMTTEVLEYLKSRGVNDKTLADFKLGFAKPEWRALRDHLAGKFSDEEMEKAGLIKKSEKGYYDRFRGRIMFPVRDSSGRVIAFSGRIFPPKSETVPTQVGTSAVADAKYLNSPETPIFKKSSVLYGIDKAKDAIRKNDFSIVVEGQFDLLMSHQAGFRNTVATLGTALTDSERGENDAVNHFGMIKRLSSNIVFVFDGDKAGLAASMRAATTAIALDMNVKAADTGEGLDPADLILQKGEDAWKGVIRGAKHVIEFLLDKFISEDSIKDPLKIKLVTEEKIIPYLQYTTNPVKKSHFISVISHRAGIREEDIRDILKKKNVEIKEDIRILPEKENIFRKDYILRRLLGIILWQKSLPKPVVDTEKILGGLSTILGSPGEELLSGAKENAPDLVFEAEVFYGEEAEIGKDVEEMLANLEEEYLKIKLADQMRELEQAENSKDSAKSAEVLKEIGSINEKIQNIKSGRVNKQMKW